MPKNEVSLMLDSGAFSAWRQGDPIDLKAYTKFCASHMDHLRCCVSLDVMPGRPGEQRSTKQTEEAAAQGWKNYLYMRDAGLDPVPVYHMGERRYWLEKMLGEGCTYVGLGGVALAGDKARRPWLDEVFGFLCGSKGYTAIRTHGFGITSTGMMSRYPWASVDSVSWMKQGVVGSIIVPRWNAEAEIYSYAQKPYLISVSDAGRKGPSSQALGHGTHIRSVGKQIQNYVLKYLKEQGMTLGELTKEYKKRISLNARFYKRYAQVRSVCRFIGKQQGLFGRQAASDRYASDGPPKRFRLVFSVGTYIEYANNLKEEGIREQLISYHRVVNGPKFDLRKFVESGWFVRSSRKEGRIVL
jgi:hypothetical protein